MAHLLVSKLNAQGSDGIGRLRVSESRQAEINEVGTDGFFIEWLAKKQSENKAELRHVLLRDGTFDKLVVLGKQPNIVSQRKMRERPKRIDSHAAVVVKRKLIQFLLKKIVMRSVGRGAQLLDFILRETMSEEGFHICKSTTLNPNSKMFS